MHARRHLSMNGRRTGNRHALTILELLVTLSIIGVLAALILPAMAAAREAARRVECTNHLKQIGLALHNYHDVHNSLPAGWQWDRGGRTAFGWSVPLLPFLDQRPLYDSIDRGICLTDNRLEAARTRSLKIFLCPSDVADPLFTLGDDAGSAADEETQFPTANYLGVYGTTEPDDIRPTPPGDGSFINTRPVRFSEFTRGLSNTFVIGERSTAMLSSSWIGFDDRDEDAQCRVVGEAREGPNCRRCDACEFSSRHGGISQFLWGDGRVQGVSQSVDLVVYRHMSQRYE